MRAILACLLALTFSGCATVQKLDAANDVHALLVAIRDNDEPTFDRLTDRPALKREIQNRLMLEARRDGRVPAALAALVAPGLAELAGAALIEPEVFRSVAEYYGYSRETRIPGPVGISTRLRQLPDGRLCAAQASAAPCLLTFTRSPDGHWRLSGFDGELSMLRLRR